MDSSIACKPLESNVLRKGFNVQQQLQLVLKTTYNLRSISGMQSSCQSAQPSTLTDSLSGRACGAGGEQGGDCRGADDSASQTSCCKGCLMREGRPRTLTAGDAATAG